MNPVTIADVREAAARISGHVNRTPLRLSPYLSDLCGQTVRLKLETMQDTGAFKIRGATNALMKMSEADRARGVITMSSGNHGRGLAYASKRLGVKCVVYMSALVPKVKIDAIESLGAEVVIAGPTAETAEDALEKRVENDGLVYVHPFDAPDIVAGQGTIGLEILEDMPDVKTVLVPLSGGGLFAGVAMALKSLKPDVQMVGITMENGPAMIDSLEAGKPVPVNEVESLADALGGTIGLDNKLTFKMTDRFIDETILLSEDEIAEAMRTLFHKDHLITEGGGAVGVGALTANKLKAVEGPIAIVVSGCNVDMNVFQNIISTTPLANS